MTVTVVSAILRTTGVQSSLPVEDTRLSMAPFMMSIPENKHKIVQLKHHRGDKCLVMCVLGFTFTYRTSHSCHTQVKYMKLLHQLGLWHRKLWRETGRETLPNYPWGSIYIRKEKPTYCMIMGLNQKAKQTLMNILNMPLTWLNYAGITQTWKMWESWVFSAESIYIKDCHCGVNGIVKNVLAAQSPINLLHTDTDTGICFKAIIIMQQLSHTLCVIRRKKSTLTITLKWEYFKDY